MPETGSESLRPNTLHIEERPSLDGLFWIDPATIGTVRDIVNSAKLSTMALGVESRRNDTLPLCSLVLPYLTDEGGPQAPRQQRAIEVGFMYGSMLTRPAQQPDSELPAVQIPMDFLQALAGSKEGLDLSTVNDNYLFFMRLRDIEVHFTGSDVLAFCLATTQDHIRNTLSQQKTEEEPVTLEQTLELQSLYYAGAMMGAITHTPTELPRPKVEIMRGMRDPVEQVGIQVEFEPRDNLEACLEDSLRAKYAFKATSVDGKPAIAVIPGGLQFGPNSMSLPIYLEGLSDLATSSLVPRDLIDALIVEKYSLEHSYPRTIEIVRDVENYVDVSNDISDSGDVEKITGLLVKNFCISAHDIAHPDAVKIDGLISKEMGFAPGEINYCNEVQLFAEFCERRIKGLSKWVIGASLGGVWMPEIVGLATNTLKFNWTQPTAATAFMMGIFGFSKWLGNRLQSGEDETRQQFDKILHEFVNHPDLHKPTDSSNITPYEDKQEDSNSSPITNPD